MDDRTRWCGSHLVGDVARSERAYESHVREAGSIEFWWNGYVTEVKLAGGGSLEEATEFMLQFGPVARIAKLSGVEDLTPLRQAVQAVLEPNQTTDGIQMGAGMWIYQARNPG